MKLEHLLKLPCLLSETIFKLKLPPSHVMFASQSVLCLTIYLADPDPVLQTEDLITLDLPADHCTVVNLCHCLQT